MLSGSWIRTRAQDHLKVPYPDELATIVGGEGQVARWVANEHPRGLLRIEGDITHLRAVSGGSPSCLGAAGQGGGDGLSGLLDAGGSELRRKHRSTDGVAGEEVYLSRLLLNKWTAGEGDLMPKRQHRNSCWATGHRNLLPIDGNASAARQPC
jgi:hypothetical protein